MKKIIVFVILALIFSVSTGISQGIDQYFTKDKDVTFVWDYNFLTEPDVNGFKLYAGTRVIAISGQVKTYTYVDFPTGSTICSITATDKYGNESDKSTEIQVNKKTIKPTIPTTVKITNPAFTIIIPR